MPMNKAIAQKSRWVEAILTDAMNSRSVYRSSTAQRTSNMRSAMRTRSFGLGQTASLGCALGVGVVCVCVLLPAAERRWS